MRQATRVASPTRIPDVAPAKDAATNGLKSVSKILEENEWRVMTLRFGAEDDITRVFGRKPVRSYKNVGRSLHMRPDDVVHTEALAIAKLRAHVEHNMEYNAARAVLRGRSHELSSSLR